MRAAAGCLESPTTGILDSHSYMTTLLGQFEDAGGTWAPGSTVVGLTPLSSGGTSGGEEVNKGSAGWELTVRDASTNQDSTITAATVTNAAGLGCMDVYNLVVPDPTKRRKLYYAKGNYFAYTPTSHSPHPPIRTLIYPAPSPTNTAGLGTHLTLDMGGQIRFGPDVEWVQSAEDLQPNAARLEEAVREIRAYLPGVDVEGLRADYAGIRPKLAPQGEGGFQDFVVRLEEGYSGWVNLLGIESPGLTASLAIGDMVEGLLYR